MRTVNIEQWAFHINLRDIDRFSNFFIIISFLKWICLLDFLENGNVWNVWNFELLVAESCSKRPLFCFGLHKLSLRSNNNNIWTKWDLGSKSALIVLPKLNIYKQTVKISATAAAAVQKKGMWNKKSMKLWFIKKTLLNMYFLKCLKS
jgi:hypothetical protein